MKPFLRFLFFLGNTNLFIALCAASSSLSAYFYFGADPNWGLVAFVLFATLFTYNLQRFLPHGPQKGFMTSIKRLLLYLGAAGIVPFAFFLNPDQLILFSVAGFLSVAYAYPLLSLGGKKHSLRSIPYLKVWSIVVVWILGTVVPPLFDFIAFEEIDHHLGFWVFLLHQAAFILALTIPFDIRDLDSDLPAQKTLPMILGIGGSLRLARNAVFLSVFAGAYNYLIGNFEYNGLLTSVLTCVPVIAVLKYSRQKQGPLFYLIVVDGIIILQAVLLKLLA